MSEATVAQRATGAPAVRPLRRLLLTWVFSRFRWVNSVLLEIGFGLFFLLAPGLTMDILGIRASPEAATLLRFYGVAVASRGLLHHVAFGIPSTHVVRRGLLADIAFALPSALILVFAIRSGLAGPAAWAVVALFSVEALLELAALAALYSVSAAELESAAASGQRS